MTVQAGTSRLPDLNDQLSLLAVEAAPCGMLIVDGRGRMVMLNAQSEKILGYSRNELIGKSVEMLVSPEIRAKHAKLIAKYAADPAARLMGSGRELTALRKDGSEVLVEIGLTPVETENGLYVLAALVDITERKKLDLELHAKNEEMQQLLYAVSHDLRSPLVTIEGFSGLLQQCLEKGNTAKAMDAAQRILRGSNTMGRLLQDILELSRVTRHNIEKQPIDAAGVVDEVLSALEAQIAAAGALVEIQEPLPQLSADRSQVVQVLLNLLTNALKHGCPEPGGVITVGGHRDEGATRLFVRDSGPGIAPQFHAKIFQLFQRLSTDKDGTGFGLAAVAKVMERLAGRAWVESELGCGSTFWVSFPNNE